MLLLSIVIASARPTAAQPTPSIARLFADDSAVRVITHEGAQGIMLQVDAPPGEVAGELLLSTKAYGPLPPRTTTASFYVYTNFRKFDPESVDRVVGVVQMIARRDDGSFGVREPFTADPEPLDVLIDATGAAVVLALVLIAWRRRIVLQFRPSHLIPAVIQTSIFAYWSLYWPAVRDHVPSILLQILFAYAVDAIISNLRDGTWRIGFGPLPIVLSSNLFAWFSGIGVVVVITVALLTRTFVRRDGRHVFNPSAIGLTVAGLLSLYFPPFAFAGVFHTLGLPPNIAEVILLLSLIPLTRFRIALISVGAAIGLHKFSWGVGFPSFLLAFVLFATDPATAPRTPVGQLLFGVIVGSLTFAFTNVLLSLGKSDELAKVFPITVANVLVPWLDRVGDLRFVRRMRFLDPRWNLAHVAVWLFVAQADIAGSKPTQFLIAPHADYDIPLVNYAPDGFPRCRDNPTFCRPFTLVQEATAWVTR
jgi:hypothetical protein